MKKRKAFIFLIGLPLFFGCLSYEAYVCRCVLDSDEIKTKAEKTKFMRNFEEAQAIFLGQVIERNFYKVKFKVDRVWKGDVPDEFTMSTGMVKLENNVEALTGCDYNFENGKSYLVFAQKLLILELFPSEKISPEFKSLLQASECGWTKVLERAKQGIKKLDQINKPKIMKQKGDPIQKFPVTLFFQTRR